MDVETPPEWSMRWWRWAAGLLVAVPALLAAVFLLRGAFLVAGALGFWAAVFFVNFVSVRDLSTSLERRRRRLDRAARSPRTPD